MIPANRERWIFAFELPRDVGNGGRFVARLLKHLLRAWGVKCVATLDPHQGGSVGRSTIETSRASQLRTRTRHNPSC